MNKDVERFRRTLVSAEGLLQSVKRGGRNVASSEYTLDARMATLADLIRTSDEVCAELDRNEGLADRYARVERRHVGLPA